MTENETTVLVPFSGTKPGISMDETIAQADTLDIVFFKGDATISCLISCTEKFNKPCLPKDQIIFSHVGMVVKGKDVLVDHPKMKALLEQNNATIDENETYIFEAQMAETESEIGQMVFKKEAVKATMTGETKIWRVLFRDFKGVVTDYDKTSAGTLHHLGRIANNPFRAGAVSEKELLDYRMKITESIVAYEDLNYDHQDYGCTMMAINIPCCRPIRWCITCIYFGGDSEKAVVCTELNAMILRDLGIIPKNTNTANVSPMDFLGYEMDCYGIPKDLVEKPTILFTAFPEGGPGYQPEPVTAEPKSASKDGAINSQPKSASLKIKEEGDLNSSTVEVKLDNFGIGSSNYASVKSSTARVINNIYYGDRSSYYDAVRSSGRSKTTVMTRESSRTTEDRSFS